MNTLTRTTTPPSAARDAHRAPSARPTGFVHDTAAVFVRETRPLVRDPFSVVFSLVQPLVFLGLFGPLLVGAAGGDAASTLQWFVPGILVMVALFGTASTGANLLFEMQTGSHERTLVAPLSRGALLVGRALKDVVPLVIQGTIVVLVAVPFGFRLDVPGLVAGLVVLAVFGVGLGALSYTLALACRNRDWMFWMVHQTLLFPLMILSGMLLPLEDGPAWMQVAAAVNPLSYLVDAERALLGGEFGDPSIVGGMIAAAVTCAIGLALGVRAMRRAR
ncbi:ABC-2 type transport system permease protein [Agromyces flavus]|uniref:Transport permease protein n=1 Tax=Agromyces flavus TaxID=589382 RepID=A0A1H1YFI0_9MICO|nr:ABC transporter permease [Agromyces flavus]MCP2366670.1 ABC-2 type transport system permease protein [Agromyces flavus]GGI45140.1 ABC transporter [Agromyces flavus]SDT20019.1 ABC-2 type transport system permease protein [Agromyces flavus]